MSDLRSGERQVADTLDGIRADHRARYEWVRDRVAGAQVVDAGCGVGYGAALLADAGCTVRAIDRSADALAYAKEHWQRDGVTWVEGDLAFVNNPKNADAVVCFEALEHLPDPGKALRNFRDMAPRLYVSVPNEAVFPYRGYRFHERHYTAAQLEGLLNAHGWEVVEWWGQEGRESAVARQVNGRTLVAVCERVESPKGGTAASLPAPIKPAPESVAIVAMGASSKTWMALASQAGDRRRVVDEVWAINAMGGTIQHDRLFQMDDMRLQEARAEAAPKSNVAGMCGWLREHPGPVYTSRVYPEFSGAVEFPLADVMTTTGHGYFNNTVAYAVAYALHIGVKELHLYGCDFSYPDSHKREKGRGCVEFWLGIASARGVHVVLANDTSLLDANVPDAERFYGYDADTLKVEVGPDGFTVEREPKELPSVEEIELRYCHDPAKDEERVA